MTTLFDIPATIRSFLNVRSIPYEVIPHERDFTAQRTAKDTFTPGRCFAKTVVLRVEHYFVMAMIPADRVIDFDLLRGVIGSPDVSLATEPELAALCPDCEVGAEPPLGDLYGMPVFVSEELAIQRDITFNGGTHEDCIRMRWDDFERAVQPKRGQFTRQT